MTKFDPKKLITSIITDTKDLFGYEHNLRFLKMPKLLICDKFRLKYILSLLLKNAVDRNNENFYATDMVKVTSRVSDDS